MHQINADEEDDEEGDHDSPMQEQLSPVNEAIISTLSNMLSLPFFATIVQSLDPTDQEQTRLVASLLVCLISRWASKKTEICNMLLFKTRMQVPALLWQMIQTSNLWTLAVQEHVDVLVMMGMSLYLKNH